MYIMAAETIEHTSFFCAKINLELYFAPCKFKYIKLVAISNSTNNIIKAALLFRSTTNLETSIEILFQQPFQKGK